MSVYLRYARGTQRGEFNLQSCNYRFGCRQVAVDSDDAVKVFDVKQIQRMVVTLLSRSSSAIALVCKLILVGKKGVNCSQRQTKYPIPYADTGFSVSVRLLLQEQWKR